ncbi:MAG: 2-polyprenyl-3-methyl-6-methoxy-1,4-benzoquinone monooxygenase [Aquisalimonadaceae bacterium]
MKESHYSAADRLIMEVDRGLRTLFGSPPVTGRRHPAEGHERPELDAPQMRRSVRLMRVNHCGEVCAQALYQGQALTARNPAVREALREAADEENDHLTWCRDRIEELDGHTSYLNPLFYVGALTLGALAGAAGDRWSLGFLAATEHQVEAHLAGHLDRLPENDAISRAIVEQMREDEARHAQSAETAGAANLPAPVQGLMALGSKVMTKTTYWA